MTPADSNRSTEKPKSTGLAFPLPAKIFVCFLLNLALVAGVAAYVARGQFGFGLDSLLTGASGERIQRMSSLLVSDLYERPRSEWAGILKRYAELHQVQIAAVLNDGTKIAGTIMELPPAVLKKLAEGTFDPARPQPPEVRVPPRDRPGWDFRPGPPPRSGNEGGFPLPREGGPPPRPWTESNLPPPERGVNPTPRGEPRSQHENVEPINFEENAQARAEGQLPRRPNANPPPRRNDPQTLRGAWPPPPPDSGELESRPRQLPLIPPLPAANSARSPKFIIRAGEPPVYWIGVRTPFPEEDGSPARPATLLIALPSLGSGGLLLDYTPWLWVGAGMLVCSVLMWVPLVRGITRSIRQMTGAAGQMAQGQFGVRVDTARRDELGQLGESLNHMAGRLGEYVTGQKRFLGDIAHELCSPLARMEMALGVLEQRAAAEQQGHVGDVREEVRHMSSLVNELLSFSKAGLRAKDLELHAVPLAELCERVIQREAHGKTDIAVDIDAGLQVLADPDLLGRAIGNVVRNANRYAGDAGPVRIEANTNGGEVRLTITDSGPGVPPETLHRLFDPFYRPETARTREGGGAGLGLAIVKSCVEACGGTVAVRNARPAGLEVTFALRRTAAVQRNARTA